MESKLHKLDNDNFVIEWSNDGEFGRLSFEYINGRWVLDSECLGLESVVKIIKSL